LENNWCEESMNSRSIFYEDKVEDGYPYAPEDPLCSSVTEACRQYEYCSTLSTDKEVKECRQTRENWCKASKDDRTALYEKPSNPCEDFDVDDPRFGLTKSCQNLVDCWDNDGSFGRNVCIDGQNWKCEDSFDPDSFYYDTVNYDDWPLNYELPQCDTETVACRQLEYCD
jgi:hypothetical protein